MTAAEVAEILKLNQQAVRNWIHGPALAAIDVGRRWGSVARAHR